MQRQITETQAPHPQEAVLNISFICPFLPEFTLRQSSPHLNLVKGSRSEVEPMLPVDLGQAICWIGPEGSTGDE